MALRQPVAPLTARQALVVVHAISRPRQRPYSFPDYAALVNDAWFNGYDMRELEGYPPTTAVVVEVPNAPELWLYYTEERWIWHYWFLAFGEVPPITVGFGPAEFPPLSEERVHMYPYRRAMENPYPNLR